MSLLRICFAFLVAVQVFILGSAGGGMPCTCCAQQTTDVDFDQSPAPLHVYRDSQGNLVEEPEVGLSGVAGSEEDDPALNAPVDLDALYLETVPVRTRKATKKAVKQGLSASIFRPRVVTSDLKGGHKRAPSLQRVVESGICPHESSCS